MEVCYNIAGDIGVLESLFVIMAKNDELILLQMLRAREEFILHFKASRLAQFLGFLATSQVKGLLTFNHHFLQRISTISLCI
jgi:hypothetical protein